ncbi:MAG: hypothetical protein DI598_15055 [Pseudopedobacter saltans]|uniref:Uncharacterized protein n=1 Tax=Pseudopedobacter saltans TaxID=151895 RepID=A0A2W5EL33_9SPHI|nr:MAG: hypothetical protein DI598_15055 [Pseudopedobacter saltans]
MKKLTFVVLLCVATLFTITSTAQLKVGRSKEEIRADEDKKTAKLIGTNSPLGIVGGIVSSEYRLYRLGDTTEILNYTTDNNGKGEFTFSSIGEEKDVYNYVLGLFDNFQNNEFFVGKTRIVPMKMGNFAGTKNIAFDINPNGAAYTQKTLVLGKAGWERLFKKSIIKNK